MDFNDIVDSIKEKPFYLDRKAGQVIYCNDNRVILPQIPDKSIDLVLTDPPYGLNVLMQGGTWGIKFKHGDRNRDRRKILFYCSQKIIARSNEIGLGGKK